MKGCIAGFDSTAKISAAGASMTRETEIEGFTNSLMVPRVDELPNHCAVSRAKVVQQPEDETIARDDLVRDSFNHER
jgi:hypothetical protein